MYTASSPIFLKVVLYIANIHWTGGSIGVLFLSQQETDVLAEFFFFAVLGMKLFSCRLIKLYKTVPFAAL
jgi:hypothetical protein